MECFSVFEPIVLFFMAHDFTVLLAYLRFQMEQNLKPHSELLASTKWHRDTELVECFFFFTFLYSEGCFK